MRIVVHAGLRVRDANGPQQIDCPGLRFPSGGPAVDQECLTLKGHSAGVHGVAFSPDGTRVATASLDGTAKVWDAAGKEIHTLRGPDGWVLGVAFSPDGRRLATAHQDGTARVWYAATGEEVQTLTGHPGPAWSGSVAFSPNGSRLATTAGNDGTLKVWNAATGQPARFSSLSLVARPAP